MLRPVRTQSQSLMYMSSNLVGSLTTVNPSVLDNKLLG